MLQIKPRKKISKKGKQNRLIALSLLLILSCFSFLFFIKHAKFQTVEETVPTLDVPSEDAQVAQLDVPYVSQLADSPLINGCEVTSLTMLLNYYGITVSKNTLAQQIATVPIEYADGFKGDPNEGFVGDMADEFSAMGVFISPIAELANTYVPTGFSVVASEETTLDELLEQITLGQPVLVIATLDFTPPQNEDYVLWSTRNGNLYLTANIHAAIITDFDENYIYVNDPLDSKDRAIERAQFEETFNKMGRQSLYFAPISQK